MPGEIITLQAGQCGNQIGEQFWSQLCSEHGILSDGTTDPEFKDVYRNDYPDAFFQKITDNKYKPRAILIDMEPRVINGITTRCQNLFNPRNIYISSDGGGAGNKWGEGYAHASRHKDEIFDMINREIDNCDNFEGFQLIHSVAGGTGSGFGSLLLESLSDGFGKKLIQTYSVFGASEVVVQPYNTMLTLKRLIQNSDCNVVFDNNALMNIATNSLQVTSPSYSETNKLLSTVMAAATNTIRFPAYAYNSLTSIFTTLIPTPDLHFLIPSYTPFGFRNSVELGKSDAYNVILELLDRKLRMCTTKEEGVNLSVLDILIGDLEYSEVQKALVKARTRINYVPWTSSTIHFTPAKKSPFLQTSPSKGRNDVKGLMLANSTSVLNLIHTATSQYDQLMNRNAFLNNYVNKSDYESEHGDIMEEFRDCREVVRKMVSEYTACQSTNYLYESEDEDEDEDLL
ncbi:unnamed protein product [Ambrosiozyma monospora]|uniref:Unnamed protein product n=2 Tax=Ambrosiozyma monospora TaxID=43982 RepID=A0ACB5TSN6_AMBMO|nr:unnamed protein product [Ambrosiozyma monospora]